MPVLSESQKWSHTLCGPVFLLAFTPTFCHSMYLLACGPAPPGFANQLGAGSAVDGGRMKMLRAPHWRTATAFEHVHTHTHTTHTPCSLWQQLRAPWVKEWGPGTPPEVRRSRLVCGQTRSAPSGPLAGGGGLSSPFLTRLFRLVDLLLQTPCAPVPAQTTPWKPFLTHPQQGTGPQSCP